MLFATLRKTQRPQSFSSVLVSQVFRVPTLVGFFHGHKSPTEVGTPQRLFSELRHYQLFFAKVAKGSSFAVLCGFLVTSFAVELVNQTPT